MKPNENDRMLKTTTQIPTDATPSYLYQLGRHFAKQIPAKWTDVSRTAGPEWATTILRATVAGLHIECMSPDQSSLERLSHVVGQHVEPLTRKNPAPIQWSGLESCHVA